MMEAAYLTTYDPQDMGQWSGSGYFIGRTIRGQFKDFKALGPLQHPLGLIGKAKEILYPALLHKEWVREREVSAARDYARQVEKKLQRSLADFVFSPGSVPIAFLQTDKPIFFWTDAVFAGMLNYYPEYCNLHPRIIEAANIVEQDALRRCRMVFFASEWAAECAIANYTLPPDKVRVVPFGANIDCGISYEEAKDIIASRSRTVCKLLFVGVDWLRKGGDIALQTAEELTSQGLTVELHIVGCQPGGSAKLPDYVIKHGFISKATKNGIKVLARLFAEAHFMLVPSRQECYGLVFCEAAAFALPAIATNTGGISTIIKDGVNGRAFGLEAKAADYATFIADYFGDWRRYQELALSSYNEYRCRLNWQTAGAAVKESICARLF
jgi:glycosyltransferase involved in cell wall biosynthesis